MFGIRELFGDDINIDIKKVLLENRDKIEEFQKEPIIDNVEINFTTDDNTEEINNLNNIEIAMRLKKYLPKYIYGQEYAISSVVNYFKHNLIKTTTSPKATFLFLGPSSTGKTYMAEMIANLLKDYKYKVFHMSQFVKEDSGLGLYGVEFQYNNSTPGELTSFVLNNPKSIIVFDEIEKAHTNIQNNLLSIFSFGKLKDKNGWVKSEDDEYIPFNNKIHQGQSPEIMEVDFSETILIFTSNVGKELYNSHYFWDLVDNNSAENMIIEALQNETKIQEGQQVLAITPPFLSRISSGGLALFKKLDFKTLLRITKDIFNKNLVQFKRYYNIEIEGLIDFVYAIFLLSFSPKIDIRRIKTKIVGEFLDIVTNYIVANGLSLNVNRKIEIKIEDKVKNYFFEEIRPLLDDDIIKYMFRKNLTLNIKKELEYRNNRFIYTIKEISLEKIKNVKDIGDNGIIFEVPEVRFDDIAGHKKAKERLKEVVTFMKNPKELKKLGVDIPKGILLYGPPGTGKTMLAKALSNEAGLPFLATTGSDLLNLDKIDKIFDTAKEYAPSIIFIDEFDTIGDREKFDNREVFINKLLSKINGFYDEDIFIIAATNYPQNIDQALLRSGRIDIKIEIKSLDKEARKAFIEKVIKDYETKGDFDIDRLVLYTTNLNGADLEKIKRECGIYMIRKRIKYLTEDILIDIINRVKYGEKIEDIDISHTLEATAIHEAGHAVISKILRPELKVTQITIIPRDKTLGFSAYENENEYKNLSKQDIKKEIQILLAGRFAQIKKYGDEGIDSGASDDLDKATKLIYLAITTLGMDDEIGHLNISNINIDFDIKNRIKAWIKEAEDNVKILIDDNWDKIESVANRLLDKESIEEKELIEIIT